MLQCALMCVNVRCSTHCCVAHYVAAALARSETAQLALASASTPVFVCCSVLVRVTVRCCARCSAHCCVARYVAAALCSPCNYSICSRIRFNSCICVLLCVLVYAAVHCSMLQRVATAPAALACTSTLAFVRVRGGGEGSLSNIQKYKKTKR